MEFTVEMKREREREREKRKIKQQVENAVQEARGKNESWHEGGSEKRGRRGIGPGRSLPSFPVTHAAPLSPPLLSITQEFYVFALPISISSTIAFLLLFFFLRFAILKFPLKNGDLFLP